MCVPVRVRACVCVDTWALLLQRQGAVECVYMCVVLIVVVCVPCAGGIVEGLSRQDPFRL